MKKTNVSMYPKVLIDIDDLVVSESEARALELAHRDGAKRLATAEKTASYWRKMDVTLGAKEGLTRLRQQTSLSLLIRGPRAGESATATQWRQRWQYEWCLHFFRPICALPHGITVGEDHEHFKNVVKHARILLSKDSGLLLFVAGEVSALDPSALTWPEIVDHVEKALVLL